MNLCRSGWLFVLAGLLPVSLAADQTESDEPAQYVRGGLGTEIGAHFGSPLKLSVEVSHLLPVTEGGVQVVQGFELRREGLEFLGGIGLGGGRAAIGWGVRNASYLEGWSVDLGVVETWKSFEDPLAYPPGHTLGSFAGRMVGLGVTVRAEILYDLDAGSDRWGLGWSIGMVAW